jgi:hypothetical protein
MRFRAARLTGSVHRPALWPAPIYRYRYCRRKPSFRQLVSDEWQRNNTDMLSPGEEDTGRTTAEIIEDERSSPASALASADLPLPLLPTKAQLSPARSVRRSICPYANGIDFIAVKTYP